MTEIRTAELLAWLADLAQTATEDTLPAQVWISGGKLYGVSTDRFVLAQVSAQLKAETPDAGPVTVPSGDVSTMVKLVKACKPLLVTVTIAPGMFRLTDKLSGLDFTSMSEGAPQMIQWHKFARTTEGDPATVLHLSSSTLPVLAAVAKRRKANVEMHLNGAAGVKPAMVRVGEDYVAAVMPARAPSQDGAASGLPSWDLPTA